MTKENRGKSEKAKLINQTEINVTRSDRRTIPLIIGEEKMNERMLSEVEGLYLGFFELLIVIREYQEKQEVESVDYDLYLIINL